jgi:formylglycine-generating enzyme required for sulfatase activity
MVVIPGPVEFLMGSPPTEVGREGGPEGKVEKQHRRRIGRSFAIANKEVTLAQFCKFYKDFFHEDYGEYGKQHSPTPACPVNAVSWYQAAAYCNWLSRQEGIADDQWCYLANAKGEYAEGMKPAPGYLRRTGYRLPSEAEWEYACRAGAVTSRYYGETEELLGRYAWYSKNSQERGMLPGAPGSLGVRGEMLKPNDFGLFDLLGNAVEWCQDSYGTYPSEEDGRASEDVEYEGEISDRLSRPLRGGSFNNHALKVRCANRNRNLPSVRDNLVGFRPARTVR